MNFDPDVDEGDVDVHQCDSCGALHVTIDDPIPDACEDCGNGRVVPPGIAVKDSQPRRSRHGPRWLSGTVLGTVGAMLNIAGAVALPPTDALVTAEGQAVVLNADAMARMVPPTVLMALGLAVLVIGVELGGASR